MHRSASRPAPDVQTAAAVILQEARRDHDVHVAVGDALEVVHDAREEVHVALRHAARPGGALGFQEAAQQHRWRGGAPVARGRLQGLEVHAVHHAQRLGRGARLPGGLPHVLHEVQQLVGRARLPEAHAVPFARRSSEMFSLINVNLMLDSASLGSISGWIAAI